MLDELKQAGVNVAGFDERSTWSLRAVAVNGPFEVRIMRGVMRVLWRCRTGDMCTCE